MFKPAALAVFLMSAELGTKGTITAETAKFFVMGLPCRAPWNLAWPQDLWAYQRGKFRKIVLALPFVSSVTLMF